MHSGPATLSVGFAITASFALVEAGVGFWSGSLALVSDAGHMITDSFALAVAALASRSASRKPLASGPHRVEVAAALLNSALMAAVVVYIAMEALERLQHPVAIKAVPMLAVAVLGLAVNILVAWVVSRGERTLNSRAALLHVMGDALGSLAAIIGAVVILATGWLPIDPILSLLVVLLICVATFNLLRDCWGATRGSPHHGHSHHGHHH